MKRDYYFSLSYTAKNADKLIELLKEAKIKYEDIMGNSFCFQFYSDNERADDILKILPRTPIVSAVFSNEEMENANWYTFEATRLDIETSDEDYTYEFFCPYETITGTRYRHRKQVNPYISKRTPKWKNNYNFCAINTGDFSTIFCSDIAKRMIQNRNISGIDFMPVVNRKNIPTENVSQLCFSNILPRKAFNFIGEYREIICPTCGKIDYEFVRPNDDNLRINTDLIPDGIDVFSAEMSVFQGWGVPPVIVSKKFCDLVSKELKEKHVRFYPIG